MKINFAASLVLLLFSFGCSNQTKSAAPSNEPPGTAHREPSGSSAQGVNQDQGSSGPASGTPSSAGTPSSTADPAGATSPAGQGDVGTGQQPSEATDTSSKTGKAPSHTHTKGSKSSGNSGTASTAPR